MTISNSPSAVTRRRPRAERFAFARSESGNVPFERFVKTLPAPAHRRALARRLDTFLEHGHQGNAHACWVGPDRSIYEIRIYNRPGVRAYFSTVNGMRVFLTGGTKNTQRSDLSVARRLLSAVEAGTTALLGEKESETLLARIRSAAL